MSDKIDLDISPEPEDFGNDIVTVLDENGVEHVFEELDRIEPMKVNLLP